MYFFHHLAVSVVISKPVNSEHIVVEDDSMSVTDAQPVGCLEEIFFYCIRP